MVCTCCVVVCTCCGVVWTWCGVVCTCCGVVCTCCGVVWTWCVRVVRDVVTWMCRRNERFDFVVSVVSCSLSSWNGWNGWMDGWMHTGRVVGRMEGALRRAWCLPSSGWVFLDSSLSLRGQVVHRETCVFSLVFHHAPSEHAHGFRAKTAVR